MTVRHIKNVMAVTHKKNYIKLCQDGMDMKEHSHAQAITHALQLMYVRIQLFCTNSVRLLTALTVDFHTIFVTKSSILFRARSSVMIIPIGQVRVYFAGPEHPDPGEC